MSAVQALAALLSANADAGSRVAASSIAANASNANANAALQGDIYRSNTQGQIANRGIDADMQRFVGEQALRSMLGKQQLGIEAGRLGLGREQLGINRQQLNQDRDFRLGEIGQGPYAPKTPDMTGAGGSGNGILDMLKGVLGGDQQPAGGDMQEYARRMIMANPGNPRVAAAMSELLNQGQTQQRWQTEMDWKKGALSDPNAMFAAIAPHMAGMEGVNAQNFGGVLANLRAQLGGGGGAPLPSGAPATPGLTNAAQTIAAPDTAQFLQALGVDVNREPGEVGDSIAKRVGTLTSEDLQTLQSILLAKQKTTPDWIKGPGNNHPGLSLLRQLLGTSASSLNPAEMATGYDAKRKAFNQMMSEVLQTGQGWGGMGSY